MLRITITNIEMKPSRCLVHTTEGKKYGIWNDKVGKFGLEIGGTYDVDIETNDVNGRNLTNITSAKRIAGAPPVALRPPNQTAPAAAGAPFRTPEQMTVTEIICAYIGAGKCANPKELKAAMQDICNAFRATWPDAYPYDQAAE